VGALAVRRVALVAIALVILAACGPGTLRLGEDRSGSTIQAEPGQEIVVALDANSSVGYTWDLTTDPDEAVVRFVDETFEEDNPGAAGGGGMVRFRFEAVGPGTTELVISRDYRGQGVDRTFALTIEVGAE
jgi:predicted secreted protein